jgi:peptidoglycan/xylan/chitin deacetylase (PgdA/CDA1 family)
MKFGGRVQQNKRGSNGLATKRLLWPAARAVVPFPVWRLLSRASLVMPYYHMISNEQVPHVQHLYHFRSVGEFEADLDFLLRQFVPVRLEDIVTDLDERGHLPKRCFHLTFDDGFREMHDVVAPILCKKGIPATFFLNTGFLDQGGMAHHNKISLLLDRLPGQISKQTLREIEALLPQPPKAGACLPSRLLSIRYTDRSLVDKIALIADVDLHQYVVTARPYLSSGEVFNLLRQGFTIGAHSVDHPLYSELSLEDQITQTRDSIDFIVSRFGVRTRAFAFPHTDVGVGPEFFDVMFNKGALDVCFGTRGFLRHYHPRNVERFSMEKTSGNAEAIITREYARKVYHGCLTRFQPSRTEA